MGEIARPVGLKGEFRLLGNGNFDERILRSEFLRMGDPSGEGSRPVRCRGMRLKGDVAIVRLEGVVDRDDAEALRGRTLGFESADYDAPGFPRDDDHAPFVYLDLEVWTGDGRRVGRVDDVLVYPANPVLRVVDDEDREWLLPVISDVITEVDRAAGRVIIDPLPGLLDEDS